MDTPKIRGSFIWSAADLEKNPPQDEKRKYNGLVNAGDSQVLQGENINSKIVVPNVSFQAAIKLSVRSDSGEEIQSFTLHSDRQQHSTRDEEIVRDIRTQAGENKSVSILMITNGYTRADLKEHLETVNQIEKMLNAIDIKCEKKFMALRSKQREINIDMTGSHDEIFQRYQDILMELGSADYPHEVAEKNYTVLKGANVNQHVKVPKVSDCAAIKCSVMQGGMVVQSFTLHSDGMDDSAIAANEIGDAIQNIPGENKSVSILMVTKGASAPIHGRIVGIIEAKLIKGKINCNKEAIELNTHKSTISIDINMTGTDHEIRQRRDQYYVEPEAPEKLSARQAQRNEYVRVRTKQGMDYYRNNHRPVTDLPFIEPSDWDELSDEARTQEINRIKIEIGEIDPNKSEVCVIS